MNGGKRDREGQDEGGKKVRRRTGGREKERREEEERSKEKRRSGRGIRTRTRIGGVGEEEGEEKECRISILTIIGFNTLFDRYVSDVKLIVKGQIDDI